MKERTGAGILLAVVMAAAGCRMWVPIKPADLPKLNGASGWAQQPDGTIVEISKPFDASIRTRSQSLGFKHPVESTVDDQILMVHGGNRGETILRLPDVTSVVVSQPDPERTTIAAGVCLGVALLVLVWLAVTVSSSSSQ